MRKPFAVNAPKTLLPMQHKKIRLLSDIGFTIVTIAALLSTFSAINATIYGNARLGYFLAKEGELPHKLSIQHRNIPSFDVWVIAILSITIVNSISLTEIAITSSVV